jgi:hypothetical protein
VVRVAEDDLRARGADLVRIEALDRPQRSHRHEHRCLHDPMWRGEPSPSSTAVGAEDLEPDAGDAHRIKVASPYE